MKTVDISGMGTFYEQGCQKMLWSGIKWLEKHPKITFEGTMDSRRDTAGSAIQIVGVTTLPEHLAGLRKVLLKANPHCSGAQYQFVIGHLEYIQKNGYKKWLGEFKDQPKRIYEIDVDKLLKEKIKY